jgi:hypothetical protein
MMTMRFSLVSAPYSGRLFRATTPMLRLTNEYDYASCHQLRASGDHICFHVSYSEKYQLLEWLLGLAREELQPLERILLTAKQPSAVRYPPCLLAEDVFMCHDASAQAQRMQDIGRPTLVIKDTLVRHPLEYGDNRIELSWIGPQLDPAAFERLGQRLAQNAFLRRE